MVAGASGVDGYLLCVAADDGVMPQTREHMAVLRLLGVGDGVVAVTKADLAPPGPAAAAIRELVGRGPEVVRSRSRPARASSVSGARSTGWPAACAGARPGPPAPVRRPRVLPAGRRRSTGTLWGRGSSRATGSSRCPGAPPGGCEVQAHERTIARAGGGRTALNLAGMALTRSRAGRASFAPATDGRGPTSSTSRWTGCPTPGGGCTHGGGSRRSSGRPRCRPPACCWRRTLEPGDARLRPAAAGAAGARERR